MFLVPVIAFIIGIYIEATCSIPLIIPLAFCILFLCAIPIVLRRTYRTASFLVLVCFFLAGMIRIGIVTEYRLKSEPDETHILNPNTNTDNDNYYSNGKIDKSSDKEMDIYDGIVTEASPNTKIVKVTSPEPARGLRIILRTEEKLTINDRVRIFGYIKEFPLTFKNPYTISWKWLKRLEGISYEFKGTIISITAGESYIEAWRRFLAEKIDNSGAKNTGIIKALTIGDTTGLDDKIKELFLKTGTSHILAISGSNIGIITAFFFFITRILIRFSLLARLRGDDKKYAALLSIPFAVLFMLTAGSNIPVIRATIMITVYMFAVYFGRTRHIENTIALSALIILLIYPHSIFMPIFQLTFLSVYFIIVFTRAFFHYAFKWNPVLKWSFSSILITVSAMIGTLPVILYHFHGVNPLAFIYNIIAVPLMCAVSMPIALAGLFIPYGGYLLRLSGEIISVTLYMLSHLNMGYLYPLIRPTFFEALSYFAIIISLLHIKKKLVRFVFIFALMPIILAYSFTVVKGRFYNNDICFNFIDVGLGDAILVEAPHGMRMLIDGGGTYSGDFDTGKSVLTPLLLSRKILSLDYVINTHPHGDHIGGLLHVLNNFQVNRFITGTYIISDPVYNKILTATKEKNIPIVLWKKGDKFLFDNRLSIHIFNPSREITIDNLNNRSLVMKIEYGKNSFLFTGDIERTIEEQLILSRFPLYADMLKVPHHGSRYSSSAHFLHAVKPSLAVMSTGAGIKGILSEEIINRYQAFSIPVLRTDKDGLIKICSDGKKISYCTHK